MNNNLKSSTYFKTLLMMISSSVFFFILFIVFFNYVSNKEVRIFKAALKLYDNEVDTVWPLIAAPYVSVMTDLTYWDEFVDFIKTKDEVFFDENILRAIDLYGVDYVAVYDLKGVCVKDEKGPKIHSSIIIPIAALDSLYKLKKTIFYMKIPDGVIEVIGVTVNPSSDPFKIKTKPAGYYFMVKLLDVSYLNDIGKICSSNVRMCDVRFNAIARKDSLFSVKKLDNYDHTIASNLVFKRPLQVKFSDTKEWILLIILLFFANVVIVFYYTRKWVYVPLQLVRKILESNNEKSISVLKNIPGEFGYIGSLFGKSALQNKLIKKAKTKAEESDKLKSTFLANLSHEIRTPMNAIIGFTDLLMNTKLSKSEKLEYLGIIDKSGKNLVCIIDDLIEMSKIDTNQLTPNLAKMSLDSCLNEIYETIKVTIPSEKKIEFKFEKGKQWAKYPIISDEVKLKQILVNLITNALKFTDTGFVVFGYEINELDKKIDFFVKDSGVGIIKKNQKEIFDRFKRVDNDMAIKVGGLGLGLAISKAYVEMLGGGIKLESKPGNGSCFSFTIPLEYINSDSEGILPKKEESISNKIEQGTILIAEDDAINYLLFQKIMSTKKYKIIRAVNGKEAVEICLSNPNIDLVLMDIKMPIMDGYEAFEKIHVFRPNLPIVAQTAYSSSDDKDKMTKMGFSDYIIKPLNREETYRIINNNLLH